MAVSKDTEFMTKALQLAEMSAGKTLPNPMVGAVLVKKGRIIGQGSHKGPGTPHAEVVAIKRAGSQSSGATLYVNLEPCCHTGRTGPCTKSIINAGIKKVIYAATDPNPNVNGKGAKELRKAGIEVSNGLMTKESLRLNDAYAHNMINARPSVTVKLAQSLDGRIATVSGDSKWISSMESRKYVHKLRSETQAVMVGMGTVQKDNPKLTTRLIKGRNPYRILVGNNFELSNKANLITENSDFKTIVASTEDTIAKSINSNRKTKLTYWSVKKNKNGQINLKDLIEKAKEFGIYSILVEGGAELVTSLLKAKLVDKLILITAPIILGAGLNSVNDLGIIDIKKAIKFKDFYRITCGADEIFVGYPVWGKK